ncbi:hypothetical protein HMPREF9123_1209 [Neisseria bacilliformis ATCC BAA-1200]|uniref:Uncharacterized protein n=1 Tax=Neisseria bacilliformis ATCC BAA-1200 TaxID=888742 RepID=F2BBV4_9NEIS|nr:hypothetical protein HMPREF9123_1209 [Neisseria bacilliformis ATCC BAA-1200]
MQVFRRPHNQSAQLPQNPNRVRGLRHTPYFGGRGRLKNQNPLFQRLG